MKTDQMSHWHEFAGNVLKVSVLQAKDNQYYLHNLLIYLGLPPGLFLNLYGYLGIAFNEVSGLEKTLTRSSMRR